MHVRQRIEGYVSEGFSRNVTGIVRNVGTVRRQIIWRKVRRRLTECGPRLGVPRHIWNGILRLAIILSVMRLR